MDDATLKLLGEVLAHGGSAGTIIAVYVAMRALAAANRAVGLLRDLKDNVATANADERRLHERQEEKMDRLHDDISTLPLRIARLVKTR